MARRPRIEYRGAIHHVMSRGNDGIAIFRDDVDRRMFLTLLAEETARVGWIVHEYCLMGNHYHLKIETPECTLSMGMHRLLTRYSQWFNRRHGRRGHLFQERFKNVLVQEESYGLELSRYIALNPVRARLVQLPEQWEWSSYRARAGLAEPPAWLTLDPLLSLFGEHRELQHIEYRRFVLAKVDGVDDVMDRVVAGTYLGERTWIDHIQNDINVTDHTKNHPRALPHPGRPQIDDVVEAVARTFDTTPATIRAERGGLARSLVAWLAFEDGLIRQPDIARDLGLRSAGGISALLGRVRTALSQDPALRDLLTACRQQMRCHTPPEFVLPPETPPPTMRGYHALASGRAYD
jgi:putative transposase